MAEVNIQRGDAFLGPDTRGGMPPSGTCLPRSAQAASLPIDTSGLQQSLDALMRDAGFAKGSDGAWVPTDSVGDAREAKEVGAATGVKSSSATGAQKPVDVMGASEPLPPVSAPKCAYGVEEQEGFESFAAQVDQAFEEVLVKGYNEDGSPIFKSPDEITSEDLLAIFMKLQIGDPSNSPEVMEKALALAKDQTKGALEQERANLEKQDAAIKEAENKSGSSKIVSYVVCAVMIVVAVALSVVTFGAGGALLALAIIAAGAIIGAAASGGKIEGAIMGAQIGAAVMIAICTLGAGSAAASAQTTAAQAGSHAAEAAAASEAASATAAAAPTAANAGAAAGASANASTAATSANVAETAAIGAKGTATGVQWTSVGIAGVQSGATVAKAYEDKRLADIYGQADEFGLAAKQSELRAQWSREDVELLNDLIKALWQWKSDSMDAGIKMSGDKHATNLRIANLCLATSK